MSNGETTHPQAASDLRTAFRAADEEDWRRLDGFLGHSGHGKFWRAVMAEVRAALARPAPDATPAGADVEALQKVAKWLEQRMDAAEGDRDAHPKDHALNRFYGGQAIAYENALSLVLNTARELKTVLTTPPASAADGEGLRKREAARLQQSIHAIEGHLDQFADSNPDLVLFWAVVRAHLATTPPPSVPATRVAGLDLSVLHAANIERQAEWCPDQVPDLSFRGNELAGETGEACNVIKKLERERQGWRGSRASMSDLAEELADVVICADLCAVTAGIDLSAAVTAKFNATSEKQGLATKLLAHQTPAPAGDAVEALARSAVYTLFNERIASGFGNKTLAQITKHTCLPSDIAKAICAALAAIAQGPGAGQAVERVRHVKRGSEYEVLGEAVGQVSTGAHQVWPKGADPFSDADALPARLVYDGMDLTVYRCAKTGKLWWRFPDEFRDGRFEPAAPATAASKGDAA